jgi:beta-xylosidase
VGKCLSLADIFHVLARRKAIMKNRLSYLIGAVMVALAAVTMLLATVSASAVPAPAGSLTWLDEFDNDTLDGRWSWLREDPTHWSLTARPGFLQITAQEPGLGNNLLLQQVPPGDFQLETRVLFTPTQNIQRAGLIIYQDDTNLFMLLRAYCDFGPPFCPGNAIYFDHVEQGQMIDGNFAMTTTVLNEAYLRLIRQGAVYTGFVSENGNDWALVGAHTVVSGFVPLQIGLIADVVPLGAPEIPAYFDYFTVIDYAPKLYLPLLQK